MKNGQKELELKDLNNVVGGTKPEIKEALQYVGSKEMNYLWRYKTPEGLSDLLMSSDGEYLTGLWFEGSRDERKHDSGGEETRLPVFDETTKWLDAYFAGEAPDFVPAIKPGNLTGFREAVAERLMRIPFGETVTYGEIADEIAKERGLKRMSPQAVGGAVGWNPVCIIIPCHRVIGADGSLTGYGGGIENKEWLLAHEKQG